MNTKEIPVGPNDSERFAQKVLAVVGVALLGATLAAHAGQGPQPTICVRSCWGARSASGCGSMSPYGFGSSNQNVLPAPTADFTPMLPPMRSIAFFAIARPIPVPG
jgi:hypothetical protein